MQMLFFNCSIIYAMSLLYTLTEGNYHLNPAGPHDVKWRIEAANKLMQIDRWLFCRWLFMQLQTSSFQSKIISHKYCNANNGVFKEDYTFLYFISRSLRCVLSSGSECGMFFWLAVFWLSKLLLQQKISWRQCMSIHLQWWVLYRWQRLCSRRML
jgi:hypothetical protein